MNIIDADTHIDETDATWEFMTGDDLPYKPETTFPANPNPNLPPARYWMIDGKRQIRFIRSDKDSGTTVETRELLDVAALGGLMLVGLGLASPHPAAAIVTVEPELGDQHPCRLLSLRHHRVAFPSGSRRHSSTRRAMRAGESPPARYHAWAPFNAPSRVSRA